MGSSFVYLKFLVAMWMVMALTKSMACQVVANDNYFINLDSTRNKMHNPTIKLDFN
jgi:hypothetical protein